MKGLEKDSEIVKFIEQNKINLNIDKVDLLVKERFLREIVGVGRIKTGIYSTSPKICPLEICSASSITNAVRNQYDNSKARLEQRDYR